MADILGLAAAGSTTALDQITSPTTPQASTQTDAQIDRTARMAAMSNSPIDQVVANYQDITAKNKEIIQKTGDLQLRYEAAIKDQSESLQALSRLNNQATKYTPDATDIIHGSQLAMQAAVAENIERRQEYAMEKRTFERVQDLAMSNPTQAAVVQANAIHGGAEDVMRDMSVKKAIIAREVEKAGVDVEQQGWLKSAVDFTAGMVPMYTSVSRGGNFDNPDVVKHWYDWLLSGQRQRSEAASLWSLPAADFAKAIREQVIPNVYKNATNFGYTNNHKKLELLAGLQNTDPVWQTNAMDAVNNIGPFIPFTHVGRITEIPYMMMRAGARQQVVDNLAGATLTGIREGLGEAAARTGISEDEILNGIVPSAINPGDPISTVGVSGDAISAVQRAQELTKDLNLLHPGRMTSQELEVHMNKEMLRHEQEIGRPLKDFKINPVTLNDGSQTYQAEFYVGKTKGGGFANSGQAQRWAHENGYGTEVIQDDSGQWFIKLNKDMPEYNGAYQIQLNPGLKNTGVIGRYLLGARQLGDDLIAQWERVSGNTRAKIIKKFVETYSDDLRKLGTKERDTLSAIMTWGERQGVWLNDEELGAMYTTRFDRTPTAAEDHSYRVMRDINDIEYGIRNDVEYKTRVVKGFSTASFEHPIFVEPVERENALVDRAMQNPPRGRVYDTTTDRHILNLTSDELEGMRAEGKVVVSLENPRKLKDGTKIKHFVVDKKGLVEEALRREQLAYRAGGHRMYENKYFAKQAVWGKQPDTGEEFLENPATYVSGTRAEVRKWTQVMEQARQLVKAGMRDPEVLTEHLAQLGYMDGETFLKYIDDGTFQKDAEFVATYDRELPRDYIKDNSPSQFVDMEETGMQGWLRTNGRMYYSSKGSPLLDWKGNLAQTVDPFEVANTALMNVASLASWSDYKISAVKRWVDTYRPYLDVEAMPKDVSDYTMFTDAKFRSDIARQVEQGGDRIKQAMEAQRDIIRRNIGWRTEFDAQSEMYQRKLENWIMGEDPESLQHFTGRKLTNWWDDSKPLRALRGFAFDMKMGLFNIAQFPLQIQTMLATTSLAGWETAGKAMINFPAMRTYLTRSGTEHFLDAMVEQGMHTAAGFETAQEYKMMMREAKASGFFDFGGTHQMINSYGPNVAVGGFRDTWNQISKAGRFFFNKGEEWNRTLAWQAAWRDLRKSLPYADWTKRDFLNKVQLKADDFALNMMEQSSAAWQHGITSVPTQFWAYNARMAEAMFGRQFTREQRIRLMLSQTFFYGSAGVPAVGIPIDLWKRHTGQTSFSPDKKPLDTIEGGLDRGMFDEMIYHMTGADVMFGKRVGTGNFWWDTTKEIFGSSQYGEKSVADVLGGATYSILVGPGFQTIKDIIKYSTAESGARDWPLIRDDILKAAANISTFGSAFKAYLGFRYGIYQTSKGTVLATNLPTQDAFFMAIGVAPGEVDQVSTTLEYLKHRKDAVNDAAKAIQNLRVQYVHEPDRRQEIAGELNALTQLLPGDISVAALKKAHQLTPTSLYDSVTEQITKDKAMAERAKQNGVTNDNP